MVESIQDFVKDKSIIFVGNSVEIMHHKHADFIDSHDIVVRFGRAIEANDLQQESIGHKCDIWVTGQFRAPCYNNLKEDFETGRFKDTRILVNRCRGNLALKSWKIEEHLPDMPYEFMYSDKEIIDRMSAFNKDILGCKDLRPSAGFITILWFIEKVRTYKSMSLIGFDFFAKTIKERPDDKKGRESLCDPHSWHMPVYMLAHSAHDMKLEQEYMSFLERKGLFTWHVLSNLSENDIEYKGWMKGMKRTKSIPQKTAVSKI
tara:strand:- start:1028 stop:1810 length:783 start_codon:yes stop_codon:yes gene_type:complete